MFFDSNARNAIRRSALPSRIVSNARRTRSDSVSHERAGKRSAVASAAFVRRSRVIFALPKVEGRRTHPLFGMYTGRTPYPGPRDGSRDSERVEPLIKYYLEMEPQLRYELQRVGRHPAKDLEGFFASHLEVQREYQTGKRKGKTYTEHHWPRRLHTQLGDRELLTRQEMVHGSGTRSCPCPRYSRHQLLHARIHANETIRASNLPRNSRLARTRRQPVSSRHRRGTHV